MKTKNNNRKNSKEINTKNKSNNTKNILNNNRHNSFINDNNIYIDGEQNNLYKISCTDNFGEDQAQFNISTINDKNIFNKDIDSVQKSKTCKEENINRLNLNYHFNNNDQNHLNAVLETINEVSNSKIDSSEINDLEENNNNKVE